MDPQRTFPIQIPVKHQEVHTSLDRWILMLTGDGRKIYQFSKH